MRYIVAFLLVMFSRALLAQEEPPFFQWSLALDIGHSFSLNRPYYSRNEVAEVTGYAPKGSAYLGGQVGMTWHHQHRLSFLLELLLCYYDHHYDLPRNSITDPFKISASSIADNYVALGATYQWNVVQHPRVWWGPMAQLGLAVVSKSNEGWGGLTYRLQPPSYIERTPVVGIYGLGTEGGYALIQNRLWVEGSLRFWSAFQSSVVTQYMPYQDATQTPQTVTIYNGLFNINLSFKLRYVI